MQVSDTCFLLASEQSLSSRGQHVLLYRSLRKFRRDEGCVLCAALASCQQAGVPFPRATQHCITPVPNQSQHDLSALVLYPFVLRRTLQHLRLVSEQCAFKTTAPGRPWISQGCASPLSVLGPSTHFPSTFINARLLQVYKSPLPAIAFVRFISLPRRFILSSALTAFSILPFFH